MNLVSKIFGLTFKIGREFRSSLIEAEKIFLYYKNVALIIGSYDDLIVSIFLRSFYSLNCVFFSLKSM